MVIRPLLRSSHLLLMVTVCLANQDAKRLYDDLINGYNSIIRPVGNNTDKLVVKMGLRLSQLIDVNLKNQIMTTNMWVEQQWIDYKLKWEPEEYGGVNKLHVPAEQIWLPDLVLYNNADGNYEITILTKAILHYDGLVIWKPPAIYKSYCEIDMEYFPFDEQTCIMKFGSWTYDGNIIDLRHINEKDNDPLVTLGMDLSAFYLSVEWDIMAVPAKRKEIFYNCCEEPFIDITFNITLRRKTLFYTFNLIIPCVAISFLSILVFYLPSDSCEKVSLSIMVMLSLVVFFLLLAEIIPPTSLSVPLLGKYLLFTMILITFSSVATIAVLNVNFRSPATHRMSPLVRKIFIDILAKYLYMKRPNNPDEDELNYIDDLYFENQLITTNEVRQPSLNSISSNEYSIRPQCKDVKCYDGPELGSPGIVNYGNNELDNDELNSDNQESRIDEASSLHLSGELRHISATIQFLSKHKKNQDSYQQVEEDWKFIAMILDRLFLWIFTVICVGGTGLIILRAPSLYNYQQPIDVLLSKVTQ